MAWPRIKNSRSSAQPGSDTHATVAPAPDAEPRGSGQNTGVSGATHAVAESAGPANTGAGRGDTGRRRLGPIRYAHSGADQTPTRAGPSDAAPIGTAPVETAPIDARSDYDQTAGLVYEAPRQDRQERPATDSQYDDDTAPAQPEDEGLAIFGGVATTEVPGSSPPGHARPMGYEPPRQPPQAEPPTGEMPVGAAWNQPIASAPRAVDDGEESRPRPFGLRVGGLGSRGRGDSGAPGSDGRPRTAVRDLPPDVQLRFWRLRLTIMIVVGLLFGIITKSWVIGLTLAILAGIIDVVYRSRNAAIYANGATYVGAQKRTRRQLAKMRRAGYFALDARPLPNSREVIDHLVVGPTGVYAIDSEKWNPKLPIRTWNGKKLYHGPVSQKPRLEHAAWEAQQASEILSAALGSEIQVRPALAIYGPKIPWDIAEIRNVDVFTGPALRKYLKRRSRMRDGVPKLTREQVRTIYDTAARLLPDLSPTPAATPVG